jgi:alpha-1,6-mannosyltransferase
VTQKPFVVSNAVGAVVLASVLAFTWLSYHQDAVSLFGILPITWLVVIGVLSGLVFLALPTVIKNLPINTNMVICMVGVGLAARLTLFASEPLWEIDYLRYLWDGGMLANGFDAYALSPNDILSGQVPVAVLVLAYDADGLIEHINYPHLRTIYPPLAEAIFALAYALGEWSLTSWRAVLLAFDLGSLGLMVLLLRHLNRSPLWAAVYWWNPLVIQMMFNAAHMDALLIPFMLAALLFAIRLRPVVMSGFLGLAVGVKLWPVLLFPTLFRHGGLIRRHKILALSMFGLTSLVILFPMITSGLGQRSGLTAFAGSWQTNSALFGAFEHLLTSLFSAFSLYEFDGPKLVRAILAGVLILVSLLLARSSTTRSDQLCQRVLCMTAVLFLLSPAAYPWYASWIFAFVVLAPNPAMMLWTATLPLYHLRFHPFFVENPDYFDHGIVWLEHGPVMVMLLWYRFRSHARW